MRALAAGYNRYLSKPIELGEFIGAVSELSRLELSAT
jgi:CheY-like chemotaxis protein